MAEIINEIPDELDVKGEELEVELDEAKKTEPEKSTADVERVEQEPKQEELFIEEEDDTPAADKGKEPLPKEMVEDLEKDDLEGYSERVKQRMAQLKKVWHDERRAKEQAAREKEEAIAYAQKVSEHNRKLQTTLSTGEEDYIKTVLSSAETDVSIAKRDYGEAYDSGDTDKIVEAQAKMNDAQLKLAQAKVLKPQYKASQSSENGVELNENSNLNIPKPDPRAQAW